MKLEDELNVDDELRPEYDLNALQPVGRGLYAKRYQEQNHLVQLAPDLWRHFPTDQVVNDALRLLLRISRESAELISLGRKTTSAEKLTKGTHLSILFT